MNIKEFFVCNEFILALLVCVISFYLLGKNNFVLVRPSKENMSNVEYSHFGNLIEE